MMLRREDLAMCRIGRYILGAKVGGWTWNACCGAKVIIHLPTDVMSPGFKAKLRNG